MRLVVSANLISHELITLTEGCRDVRPPTKGTVSYSSGTTNRRLPGTKVTYSCNNDISTCHLGSHWEPQPPPCACERMSVLSH